MGDIINGNKYEFGDGSKMINIQVNVNYQAEWRNRSIPTQFRTSESTHSVMKMTMEWP